jgi:endo-1,4-beta-xylanase
MFGLHHRDSQGPLLLKGSIMRLLLFIFLLISANWTLQAQTTTQVIAPNTIQAFTFSGTSQYGSASVEAVTGQQFSQAWRLRTTSQPANEYDLRIIAKTATSISARDLISVTFWARTIESAARKAQLKFVIEKAADPYTKSAYITVPVISTWRKYHLNTHAIEAYQPGEAQIFFSFGFAPQVIEVGGISITNHGPIAYLGRDLNAPWRAAAKERIEKIRKATLQVQVLDHNTRSVAGATVRVRMLRHKFGFGSAVDAAKIADQTTNGVKYRDTITTLFNKTVMENDLKWPNWENTAGRQRTLNAINWLRSSGIEVRGHTLVWPSWGNMPKDVETLKNNPDALQKRVRDHIIEEASALKGQLVEWDVINEPYDNHDLMDILGRREMVEWFKLTRQADPTARLYINDYAILAAGGYDFSHQDHYEETIRYLINEGAPLEGIGLQSHFDPDKLTSPERVFEILDRFAAFGRPLQSTEFDINIRDERLQADYLRDFMTTLFSHPSVSGIIMWGFWEGQHWRPDAALFRRDWSIKPSGVEWKQLVHKDWWTDVTGQSSAEGRFLTRGFKGDYEIEVTLGSINRKVRTRLDGDSSINVSIDTSSQLSTATIGLDKGWNLISFPIAPISQDIAVLFAPLGDACQSVFAYKEGAYLSYVPGSSTSALKTVQSGMGYWVYMKESGALKIEGTIAPKRLELPSGWNLTGYNSMTASDIDQALSSIKGKYTAVYAYDTKTMRYVGYVPEGQSDLKTLQPGGGYWIFMKESSDWELP